MEVLEDTPLLKFNPNTLEKIRGELNLDRDGIIQMIDNFQDWIVKQNHFTTRNFSRNYLEICIIHSKGSLERAKGKLDKLFTLKTLLPTYFKKYDIKKELGDLSGFLIHALLPKQLNNGYRVIFIKLVSSDFDDAMLLDFNRFIILMTEYRRLHDYSLGVISVIDCRDVNLMNFVTKINIVDLRNSMCVLLEGYGIRVNAIYVISPSKTIDIFVMLLKQVFSAKIADRIYVVKTVESMYEYIQREILPKDYGGDEKTLKEINENWANVLSMEENVAFFKTMSNARTDEKYRLTAKYNEDVLGMPGSFRSLSVD